MVALSEDMTTAYHARYFAHELTRQHGPGGGERLSMALFDACVDLNPHQIDAAAFAPRNLRREDQTWKVRLIEEEFQRLMFSGTE